MTTITRTCIQRSFCAGVRGSRGPHAYVINQVPRLCCRYKGHVPFVARYRYAAWTSHIPHHHAHERRTPDTAGVATVDHHPGGDCQTWSDHFTHGGSGADRPYCRDRRDQPLLYLHVGPSVSAGGSGGFGSNPRSALTSAMPGWMIIYSPSLPVPRRFDHQRHKHHRNRRSVFLQLQSVLQYQKLRRAGHILLFR